ncbi:unnamed protein product [Brugia pahangi]|uniref:Uncharacterized protein n=1 Tax=Brugia pahangi TaxID=6280 RepID=A0A0N4T002_BRUPA|nr:unnamed protein product [Brugia pahangi]
MNALALTRISLHFQRDRKHQSPQAIPPPAAPQQPTTSLVSQECSGSFYEGLLGYEHLGRVGHSGRFFEGWALYDVPEEVCVFGVISSRERFHSEVSERSLMAEAGTIFGSCNVQLDSA